MVPGGRQRDRERGNRDRGCGPYLDLGDIVWFGQMWEPNSRMQRHFRHSVRRRDAYSNLSIHSRQIDAVHAVICHCLLYASALWYMCFCVYVQHGEIRTANKVCFVTPHPLQVFVSLFLHQASATPTTWLRETRRSELCLLKFSGSDVEGCQSTVQTSEDSKVLLLLVKHNKSLSQIRSNKYSLLLE